MARPKKQFDLKLVEKLGVLQCTQAELAAALDCDRDTISDRINNEPSFSAAYKKGIENGKISLRRKQWLSANGTIDEKTFISKVESFIKHYKAWLLKEKKGQEPDIRELESLVEYSRKYKFGSVTMQIWLGKNLLDQTDKQEIAGKPGAPLTTEVHVYIPDNKRDKQ